MTKEEILAMKPGRELSGLVIVEVMGRRCAHVNLAPLNPNSVQHANGAKSRCLACGYKDYNSFFRRDFLYCSISISDAWEVVEKMRMELFSTRSRFLNALQEQTRGETWSLAWPDVFWSITPETICKAALLAKLELQNV